MNELVELVTKFFRSIDFYTTHICELFMMQLQNIYTCNNNAFLTLFNSINKSQYFMSQNIHHLNKIYKNWPFTCNNKNKKKSFTKLPTQHALRMNLCWFVGVNPFIIFATHAQQIQFCIKS